MALEYGWVLCSLCRKAIGFSHEPIPLGIRLLCEECFGDVAENTSPIIDIVPERKLIE